jgi:hypothetical protein
MKILHCALLSFAVVVGVVACSTSETAPVPEGDGPDGVVRTPSVGETANSPGEGATEGGPPMAESGGPADLYLARNTVSGKPYPQAEWTGSFAARDGCLVLELVGRDEIYLPILSENARVVDDTTIVGATADGRTLSLGVEYRIIGGTIPVEDNPDVKLAQASPARCRFTPFLVGDIG